MNLKQDGSAWQDTHASKTARNLKTMTGGIISRKATHRNHSRRRHEILQRRRERSASELPLATGRRNDIPPGHAGGPFFLALVEEGFMTLFRHGFDTKGRIPILYWRIFYEVVQQVLNPTSLLFACAIHCASGVSVLRANPTNALATPPYKLLLKSCTTRRADRLVHGRPRCAGSAAFTMSPDEIVAADRWMQSHSNLEGEELAKERRQTAVRNRSVKGPCTTSLGY